MSNWIDVAMAHPYVSLAAFVCFCGVMRTAFEALGGKYQYSHEDSVDDSPGE